MKTSALFLKQHEVHVIAQKIAESSYVLSIQLQENVCVCVCVLKKIKKIKLLDFNEKHKVIQQSYWGSHKVKTMSLQMAG